MMRRFAPACVLAIGILGAAAQAPAQTAAPDSLIATVDKTVATAKETQSELDDWSQERKSLELRYRTAQANVAYLAERIAREQEKADALDAKVAELDRRLVESSRMQAVIADTLNAVLGRLESVVTDDLPFLAEEREARLVRLRKTMADPDLDPAEKLRHLLEAMLVEAQYGETVEVAPQVIAVDGRDIHADVMRIGRLTMYWRSPDGSRVGTWDPAAAAWIELPGRYNRVIARSMEMAERMRPTELVSLPLGRIRR